MLPLHFDAALMRFRKLLADERALEDGPGLAVKAE